MEKIIRAYCFISPGGSGDIHRVSSSLPAILAGLCCSCAMRVNGLCDPMCNPRAIAIVKGFLPFFGGHCTTPHVKGKKLRLIFQVCISLYFSVYSSDLLIS